MENAPRVYKVRMNDVLREDMVGKGGDLYGDPGKEYHGVNKSGRGRKLPLHCMVAREGGKLRACFPPVRREGDGSGLENTPSVPKYLSF